MTLWGYGGAGVNLELHTQNDAARVVVRGCNELELSTRFPVGLPLNSLRALFPLCQEGETVSLVLLCTCRKHQQRFCGSFELYFNCHSAIILR